jgi:diguanylate cyclase (GGDEF)-like protein/PAS domain S-box-containing protein
MSTSENTPLHTPPAADTLEQLQQALREQQVILDTAGVGIVFIKNRLLVRCNQRFAEIFGHDTTETLLGQHNLLLYPDSAAFHALGQAAYPVMANGQPYKGEVQLMRRGGSIFWAHLTGKLVNPANTDEGSIWIIDDISARKKAEADLIAAHANLEKLVEQRTQELKQTVLELEIKVKEQKLAEAHIQQLAHFDPLTRLPNRLLLNDRCNTALHTANRSHQPVALIFLDLDHFKNINDSLGHRVGDEVLMELASRLNKAVREQDTVSRLGGDEFILLLPDTDALGATRVAEKILQAALEPFQIEQHELTVTPSIGIAMYPEDGNDLDALSKCADAAMYRAKEDGRNGYRFFTNDIQTQTDRSLLLGNALRRAQERRQLELHYQPQICLQTGETIGAEALLRWRHPELGAVSPGEFVPIAENTGLILPIGEWVIRTAVAQLANWMQRGMKPIIMAVNLSAVQFRHANLPELVTQILQEHSVDPALLELELTEGVATNDPIGAIGVMNDLRQRGVRMSIDDFGTGYSSLSYLKRFQVYKLKITKCFVPPACAQLR